MAKRKNTTKSSDQKPKASTRSSADTVERRVVAFAEQLGRIVGTVQAKTDGWLDRETLNEQLTRVRDGAAVLLTHLGSAAASAASAASAAATATVGGKATKKKAVKTKAAGTTSPKGRSGGKVDAPGKKHRKAPAVARSVKHSDETIPKAKSAEAMRSRRRG